MSIKVNKSYLKSASAFFLMLIFFLSGEQIFAQCYGPTGDCDGDGVPDHLDFDDNNNGILDSTECPITYINFSSITSVTPLVPGDSPQVFTKFLDGINLP